MYLLKAYGEVGEVEYNEDASDLSIGIVFHDPQSDDPRYLATDLSLSWETGRSGSLTFVITKNHRCYNAITPLKTYITVYQFTDPEHVDSAREYWRGRVISKERRMNGNYSITCEGIMSLLNDVEFIDDHYDSYTVDNEVGDTILPVDAMSNAIECYNKKIAEYPDEFSECCRPFIFAPINIGVQKPIDLFEAKETTTNNTVWSRIESVSRDNNGFLRAEYNADHDKYVIYYTDTVFNWDDNTEGFDPGGTNVHGQEALQFSQTSPYPNFPVGSYIYTETASVGMWEVVQTINPYGWNDYPANPEYYYKSFSDYVYPTWTTATGPIPQINTGTGKRITYLKRVYKYHVGDCVIYNNVKYVFIVNHPWFDSWDQSHVVEYNDYGSQVIELGSNLIDIVKKNSASDVYSHLKPYGQDIEFLDFFKECKIVYDEDPPTVYSSKRYEASFSVQKNKWYRVPLIYNIMRDGPWDSHYFYYKRARSLYASLVDGDGNVVQGLSSYFRLDDSVLISNITNVAITNGTRIGFNSSGNYYHSLDRNILSEVYICTFTYQSSTTLPSGSKIEIKTQNYGNTMSTPFSAYIYVDPESENPTYVFPVYAAYGHYSQQDIEQHIGYWLGDFNLTKQAYCYTYFSTTGVSDDLNSLSLRLSTDMWSYTDSPMLPRYPQAKKNASITPYGTPIDYEYFDDSDGLYPSELINTSIYNLYGRIDKIENYDDIYDRYELMAIAADKVALDSQKPYTATIKALDLSAIDPYAIPFYPGFNYEIRPYSNDVDIAILQCSAIKIPLLAIQNAEYSFGLAPDLITQREYINGQWRRKN